MTSYRYASAVCLLLGLALIPTLIHSYGGDLAADGRSVKIIPAAAAGFTSTPTDRNSAWGKRRFDSDDWIERTYVKGGDQVQVTVIRSYDAKRLYHHPELAVAYGTSFVGHRVRRFPQHPNVPVHVLTPAPGVSARAMYVLNYGDDFIDDPIRFQMRTAGELLFSRRKPMTLFFVHETSVSDEGNPASLASTDLLFSLVDSFLPGGRGAAR